MALTQGSSSSLTPPAQAQLEACVSFPPLFDARVSLPCRQQRGGAERQLETQSHHAQSALGLPQVGGETTNAKPNCDLLGPLNNWRKKTQNSGGPPPHLVGVHSLFPCRAVPQKKKNIIVFCPRLDVVQRLLSAHVVLVSLPERIGLEVRGEQSAAFSAKRVSQLPV